MALNAISFLVYSHVYSFCIYIQEATEIELVLFQRRIHSNIILVDGEKYCKPSVV